MDSIEVVLASDNEHEALLSFTVTFPMTTQTLSNSPLLQHLVDELSVGSRESIQAPAGLFEAWARFTHSQLAVSVSLPCSNSVSGTL